MAGPCCVCGESDARALVDVTLAGGGRARLCGSHAVMHGRLGTGARSESDLRRLLQDRRERPERRAVEDELGVALADAFRRERRERERRQV
jgi:hypothetical protein